MSTQADEIIDAYRSGTPIRDVATRFGKSYLTVRRVLTDAGVPIRPRGGGPLRLTVLEPGGQVPPNPNHERIRQLTAQGLTNREIAAATGAGMSTVEKVCADYWRGKC